MESREKNINKYIENTRSENTENKAIVDYNHIISLLENNRHKSTFLVDLWKNYISEKKKSFDKSLEQCKKAIDILNDIDNVSDISEETFLLLKIMFSSDRQR